MEWPFDEPKNVAVVTSRRIVQDGAFIHYVSHDADVPWQRMQEPREE